MIKHTVRPLELLTVKYNNNLTEMIIIRDRFANNFSFYKKLIQSITQLTKIKHINNNELIFIKCLLYLRTYLVNNGYKCSLREMEFITATIAKMIWRVIDKDKFDEQMAMVASDLAVVLAG